LLASLKNFLSNEAQKARCLKRGGQVQFVYVDFQEAEDRYGKEEPAESLTSSYRTAVRSTKRFARS
jgi:hypothetical protein